MTLSKYDNLLQNVTNSAPLRVRANYEMDPVRGSELWIYDGPNGRGDYMHLRAAQRDLIDVPISPCQMVELMRAAREKDIVEG